MKCSSQWFHHLKATPVWSGDGRRNQLLVQWGHQTPLQASQRKGFATVQQSLASTSAPLSLAETMFSPPWWQRAPLGPRSSRSHLFCLGNEGGRTEERKRIAFLFHWDYLLLLLLLLLFISMKSRSSESLHKCWSDSKRRLPKQSSQLIFHLGHLYSFLYFKL